MIDIVITRLRIVMHLHTRIFGQYCGTLSIYSKSSLQSPTCDINYLPIDYQSFLSIDINISYVRTVYVNPINNSEQVLKIIKKLKRRSIAFHDFLNY